jgi:hypothetical protein
MEPGQSGHTLWRAVSLEPNEEEYEGGLNGTDEHTGRIKYSSDPLLNYYSNRGEGDCQGKSGNFFGIFL